MTHDKGSGKLLKKIADTKVLPLKAIAEFFGIKGKTFQRQYKNKLSWKQKSHAED